MSVARPSLPVIDELGGFNGPVCANATFGYMEPVASRELRNHTAEVLRRVQAGEAVAVTVRGETVAELRPPADRRPRFFARRDLAAILATQADSGLRADLATLAGETTDDLDPLT